MGPAPAEVAPQQPDQHQQPHHQKHGRTEEDSPRGEPKRKKNDPYEPREDRAEDDPVLPVHSDGEESQGTEAYDEDLYVADDPTYWSTSTEGHKLAATTSSFSFIINHMNQQVDVGRLPTHPEVSAMYG